MADMYDIINSLLNEKDMNKKELAEKAKIPYSSLISAFNRRSESFSATHLQKIAIALEVTVDEMLGFASESSDRYHEEAFDVLRDNGFTVDIDEDYSLYGNINLTHFEHGITAIINKDEAVSLVDSVLADAEAYKDRYIKKRLLLEFSYNENRDKRNN